MWKGCYGGGDGSACVVVDVQLWIMAFSAGDHSGVFFDMTSGAMGGQCVCMYVDLSSGQRRERVISNTKAYQSLLDVPPFGNLITRDLTKLRPTQLRPPSVLHSSDV